MSTDAKRRWRPGRRFIALAVAGALLTAYAWAEIARVPDALQYLLPYARVAGERQAAAPQDTQDATGSQDDGAGDGADGGAQDSQQQQKTPSPLIALGESLQKTADGWAGMIGAAALSTVTQAASFSADLGDEATGRLEGLSVESLALFSPPLSAGRMLYPDELKNGSRVILLDEGLALKLFKDSAPIDRVLKLEDTEYRVVGVVRRARRVGDAMAYGAYAPLLALEDQALAADAVQVTADPLAGDSARIFFENDLETWKPGGDSYHLAKERMRALMPLRVLLIAVGLCLIAALAGRWNGLARRLMADYRARLSSEYAVRLLPRLLGYLALLAAGYAALLAGAYFALQFALEPLYVFTEWVPAVLVEYSEISKTLWALWQDAARLTTLQTPEVARLRHFGALLAAGCVLLGLLTAYAWGALQTPKTKKKR